MICSACITSVQKGILPPEHCLVDQGRHIAFLPLGGAADAYCPDVQQHAIALYSEMVKAQQHHGTVTPGGTDEEDSSLEFGQRALRSKLEAALLRSALASWGKMYAMPGDKPDTWHVQIGSMKIRMRRKAGRA